LHIYTTFWLKKIGPEGDKFYCVFIDYRKAFLRRKEAYCDYN